ncbi:MAG: hypothetical protein ABI904_07650 [Chloroflexota bacterium]
MKAYICVYRHTIPIKTDIARTAKNAEKKQPLIHKFLEEYQKPKCFYDWGDDPAFFSAKEFLGDFRFATWGVCRRDVRNQLGEGDLVIYFCGQQSFNNRKHWDYYFIGFGTVAEMISRDQLWQDKSYAVYRKFFNVLAKLRDNKLIQHEYFGNGHDDWKKRLSAPYIIFNQDKQFTDFNLVNPLFVATRLEDSPFEHWHSNNNKLVKRLEESLFIKLGVERRLRTKSEQHAHRHIPLHKYIVQDQRYESLKILRSELSEIAYHVRKD